MTELNRLKKIKYAKANRRLDFGIWGFKPSVFRELTLTTKQGDDMSVKRFGSDLKKIMKWLRSLGYKIEYCGCYEFSPINHLLHWHGLLRIKGGYFPVSEQEISEKWRIYHGAYVIKLDEVHSIHALEKYIKKHTVKSFIDDEGIRNRFLVSSGWKRKGIDLVVDEFKRWWVNGREKGSWMSKEGYQKMNEVLKLWCEGKLVKIKADFGWFKIQGKFIDSEIYNIEKDSK